jgi:coproporphyrinogen III oxidase
MKIVSFVNESKKKVINKLLDISINGKCTKEKTPLPNGYADISIIKGDAIEKASITHLVLNNVTPPGNAKPIDYMVFQMEIFPKNPFCPMGHFNTEWSMSENGPYHMNLDVFPAVAIDDDIRTLKLAMDRVAEKFGTGKDRMREGLQDHYNMDHWDAPLAASAGCKLLNLRADKLELFITAYHTFFDTYIEILKAANNRKYTESDNNLKLKRNGKWLEYITLKDSAVKMALAKGMPPEVLIKLSFPPCAVF